MLREGYVEKVIYKNEDNGYAVFAVEGEDGEDIFVGNLHGVAEGIYVSAEGEYVEHPTYDLQFKFTSCEIKMPDDMLGVEKYLGSGVIKGVGEALAKRIVKKFRMDSLRIIEEEPERLAEIRGISERKAREIATSYNEKKGMQDALMFLTGLNIPVNLAVRIYNEYGDEVYDIIKTNPYKVAEDITGVGFKTADEIADRLGIGRDSDFRVRAAIMYTLLGANRLGHMYLPQKALVDKTYSLLLNDYMPYDPELEMSICNQILELSVSGKIIIKELEDPEENENIDDIELEYMDESMEDTCGSSTNAIYAASNYYTELSSARLLTDLDIDFSKAKLKIDKIISSVEDRENIQLADAQKLAIRNAVDHGVAVITGGPGTGKTTIINVLIKIYESFRMKIVLAAPTGRAAKRITEATGYAAQTIHRMLELTGGVEEEETAAYRFARNESNPLEADVIIIDEMSMVDSGIFYSLLKAVAPGTRLVLVGDSNQLPSVGPGNVLRDIIASGVFSVSVLDRIYRQGEDSDIIGNAHKINAGEHIEIKNKSRDFFFIPRNGYNEIIDELKVLLTRQLPSYFDVAIPDIQVLTPMRKYDLGVENLNKQLQEVLNPMAASRPEHDRGDVVFRQGDKVMQIKNNYKLEWKIMDPAGKFAEEEGVGVFNGDIGFIKTVDDYDQKLVVEFDDGRQAEYPYGQLDELEHAFAITIHKSQGSEYPVVVIPLLRCPPKLLNRNLLYTAVTRARKCVVIVGNIGLANVMIDNEDEQRRYTSFAKRLREIAGME
ncbi:MAG: ATP-dependent RecD-like DNA helicase [Clostridiales bacterium]|nr:ATP-dependent RecD-like DNA helicase [Clostridiales bacterium]